MKAILVIDMPNDCDDCPLNAHTDYDFDICWIDKKSKGVCPLKPMPEPKYVEVNEIEDLMHTEFSIENLSAKIRLDTDKLISLGWNACLEEIEK